MAYIIKNRVDRKFETIDIDEADLLIGRSPTAQLRLDDEALAPIHASIIFDGNRFELLDHQTPTGTYLNGERIHRATLRHGDRITIGTHILRAQLAAPGGPLGLEVEPAAPTAAAAAPTRAVKIDYAGAYSLRRNYLNKTVISLVLTGIGLLSLAGALASGKAAAFRPGMVSAAHALIANQCFQCHSPWQGASEAACRECHDGSKHHEQQSRTPSCFSCHPEHRGQISLVAVENRQCVTCHADLKLNSGAPPAFAARVTDFNRDHPEFAIVAPGAKRVRMDREAAMRSDPGKLALNHALHLKPEVKDPNDPDPVSCHTCHRPNVDGRQMTPMTFREHCQRCHELVFDPQFPKLRAPHGDPEIVRAYLVNVYAEAKGVMIPPREATGRIPNPSPAVVLSPAISARVAGAEAELYKVHCKKCHEVDMSAQPLPKVVSPNTPVLWFRHGRFAHKPHRLLQCVVCHERAPSSEKTSDVLLPGIQTCRSCHFSGATDGAPTNCSACHTYHDKEKDRHWKGTLKLNKVLGDDRRGK